MTSFIADTWGFEKAWIAVTKQFVEVRRRNWNEHVYLHYMGNGKCEIRVPGGGWRDYEPDIFDKAATDWIPVLFSDLTLREEGSFGTDGQFHFKNDIVKGKTWKGKMKVSHSANKSTFMGHKDNIKMIGY